MIVIQFERYPELCWHTTHQHGSTGERSASYISGLLSLELWWLFIKSTQQGSKIWIPSSSCRRLPVGEQKEGLASRILWKVWDIWLPSSIYMTPDSNYWKPHPLWPDYHGNLWPRGHPHTEPHAFMQPFSRETNSYKKKPTRKTRSHFKFIVLGPTKHTFSMHYCLAITIRSTGSVADVPGVNILRKCQRRRHHSPLTEVCGSAQSQGGSLTV